MRTALRTSQSGFSLLEIMIVVLIIAIGASTVRLLTVSEDPLDDVETGAHSFEFWFSRQLDQALLTGDEIGFFVTEESVVALNWREGDPDAGEPDQVWERSEAWSGGIGDDTTLELMLDNEARQWVALSQTEPETYADLQPHIILLPSEEYFPSFTMFLTHESVNDEQVQVIGDGYNRAKVVRNER